MDAQHVANLIAWQIHHGRNTKTYNRNRRKWQRQRGRGRGDWGTISDEYKRPRYALALGWDQERIFYDPYSDEIMPIKKDAI